MKFSYMPLIYKLRVSHFFVNGCNINVSTNVVNIDNYKIIELKIFLYIIAKIKYSSIITLLFVINIIYWF